MPIAFLKCLGTVVVGEVVRALEKRDDIGKRSRIPFQTSRVADKENQQIDQGDDKKNIKNNDGPDDALDGYPSLNTTF